MSFVKKRIILYSVLGVVGAVVAAASLLFSGHRSSTLAGLGAGMFIVSLFKCIQLAILARDPKRLKRFENMQREERYQFIAKKSGAMTFYITMLALFIASIIARFAGGETVADTLAFAGFGTLGLYGILFLIYSRRY